MSNNELEGISEQDLDDIGVIGLDQEADSSEMNDKSEGKTGLVHYKGSAGECDYDPTMFKVVSEDFPGHPGMTFDRLQYIGSETDGSKIKIPDGLTSCHEMFYGTDIKTMPDIPSSVKNAFGMFANCRSLETANVLPESLINTSHMFFGCSNLKHGPSFLPNSVKDASDMFFGCDSLLNAPIIDGESTSLIDASGMLAYCKSLQYKPDFSKLMAKTDNAFLGTKFEDEAVISFDIFNKYHNNKQVPDDSKDGIDQTVDKSSIREMLGEMFKLSYTKKKNAAAMTIVKGGSYVKDTILGTAMVVGTPVYLAAKGGSYVVKKGADLTKKGVESVKQGVDKLNQAGAYVSEHGVNETYDKIKDDVYNSIRDKISSKLDEMKGQSTDVNGKASAEAVSSNTEHSSADTGFKITSMPEIPSNIKDDDGSLRFINCKSLSGDMPSLPSNIDDGSVRISSRLDKMKGQNPGIDRKASAEAVSSGVEQLSADIEDSYNI